MLFEQNIANAAMSFWHGRFMIFGYSMPVLNGFSVEHDVKMNCVTKSNQSSHKIVVFWIISTTTTKKPK